MIRIFSELSEIEASLETGSYELFAKEINQCNGVIIGLGAGRMGYSLQAFIMRLSHLGKRAYMLSDTSLPRIGANDLVIVNSSSGETPTIYLLAEIAKQAGARILLLTTNSNSSIATLADVSVRYSPVNSRQLMKTAYEQFTFLFFDHIAGLIAENSCMNVEEIEQNHSILE